MYSNLNDYVNVLRFCEIDYRIMDLSLHVRAWLWIVLASLAMKYIYINFRVSKTCLWFYLYRITYKQLSHFTLKRINKHILSRFLLRFLDLFDYFWHFFLASVSLKRQNSDNIDGFYVCLQI